MNHEILVAGIGNVFFGDDGFGLAVVDRLRSQPLPEHTRIEDYGIRGLHLAFELLEPPTLLILVDAAHRDQDPGTLYLIDPEDHAEHPAPGADDPHCIDADQVFEVLHALGGQTPKTRIVGCEPADLSERMELSDPVRRAVPAAVTLIHRLIEEEIRHGYRIG